MLIAALWGCGRIGFESTSAVMSDGGGRTSPDAAPGDPNASADDGSVPEPDGGMDASIEDAAIADASIGDAAVADAAIEDAAVADAAMPDAATSDAAMPDGGVPPDGDFCEALEPLPARPAIDGELEPGLSLLRAPPVSWTGQRPLPIEMDAYYAVAYHADGVYFFVVVIDSTRVVSDDPARPYCGDSVELHFDIDGLFPIAPDYDVPGTTQFVIAAPTDDVTPSRSAALFRYPPQMLGMWASQDFIAVPTAQGYAVEALITGADMELPAWMPIAGEQVGLALSINVAEVRDDPDADCGHRLGQYFNRISDVAREGWCPWAFCTTDAFCVAPLQP